MMVRPAGHHTRFCVMMASIPDHHVSSLENTLFLFSICDLTCYLLLQLSLEPRTALPCECDAHASGRTAHPSSGAPIQFHNHTQIDRPPRAHVAHIYSLLVSHLMTQLTGQAI